MRRIAAATLILVAGVLVSAFSPPAAALHRAIGATPPPSLLYIAAGHLWLRSVDGGSARSIATPWPTTGKGDSTYSNVQWSPDGQRVALDGPGGRLAVIRLATGHITVLLGKRCSGSCAGTTFAWSPNGRYLALLQPAGKGDRAILRVWDSRTGSIRSLLGNVPAYVASPVWSHASARVAIPVGTFDAIKSVFPEIVTVDLAGHVAHLGKGQYVSWSPDDRLAGIIRPNYCGANTCDEDVVVRSSAGGTPIVLARHSTSLFDNPIWAPQPHGYAFDRWLLNPSGHATRRLAGPHERVLSWRSDGSRLALQTYHPYQGTPDVLYLSTPDGRRTRFYTDGWNEGCGVCSKDVYSVSWGRGDLFAFSTPTYPTPKNVTVYPRFFVASAASGSRTRIGISGTDSFDILGLVESDRVLVIHAGTMIYRYDVPGHHLSAIVTGVPAQYGIAFLDPRTLAPSVLRSLALLIPLSVAAAGSGQALASVRAIIRGLTVTPPSGAPVPGHVGDSLFSAYGLGTRAAQRAKIRFVDGTTLHMNQRTDLVLQSQDRCLLRRGEVKATDNTLRHRIQTPAALVTANGTIYDVRIGPVPRTATSPSAARKFPANTTNVSVITGTVRVSNRFGSVTVRPGEWTHVVPGTAPAKPTRHRARNDVAWTRGLP